MSTDDVAWLIRYMPSFASAFMDTQYQRHATEIALNNLPRMYQWASYFEEKGIPFRHVGAVQALLFTEPYRSRRQQSGKDDIQWIESEYHLRFKATLQGYDLHGLPGEPDDDGPELEPEANEIERYATQLGRQTFTLPAPPSSLQLFINGLKQNTSECELDGVMFTVTEVYAVHPGDYLVVRYL